MEILDDRYDKSATIITSQLDVKQWHAFLDDPTLADAILDRVVHNAYHLDLSGESIRKLKSLRAKTPKTGVPRLPGRSRSSLLARYRRSLCYQNPRNARNAPIQLIGSGYPPSRAHGL